MKKQFLAITLLLSVAGARAIETEKMIGIGAVAVGLVGVKTAALWNSSQIDDLDFDDNNKANTSILDTIGKPFKIDGRGVLRIINTGALLTSIGCLVPGAKPVVITAGGTGATVLALQSALGFTRGDKVDTETTVKWTGLGTVLGLSYKYVPPVNAGVNNLLGWK